MARAATRKRVQTPADEPITYAYGVRTWGQDGQSYGGFKWDLTIGARTTAPDWKPTKECGRGLHANLHGMEDWSLLGDLSDVKKGGRVFGVVRWDAALAIDLDGKHKAPWMEIVLTTETADLGTVLAAISTHRNEHLLGLAERLTKQESTQATTGDGSAAATTGNRSAAATTGYGSAAATTGDGSAAATTGDRSAAATTGDGSAAATTGDRSAAATTGYGSAAATTGYRSAAATTGKHSIAAALGPNGTAKASSEGAIVLAAFDWNNRSNAYDLRAVFAGMVGQTYGETTIQPDTWYRLRADGVVEAATDA